MNKVLGVIPARYHSTRLPGKMLREIEGKPLVQRVWENAKKAKRLHDLLIATDHEDIFKAAESFGAQVVMTDPNHPSGTDRIQEAVKDRDCEVVVNIQGDEPFLDPSAIDDLAEAFDHDQKLQVGTLCFKTENQEAYNDPNVVKVVLDRDGFALYFSRAPIPFYREGGEHISCFKHFGIYAYRKIFLLNFSTLPKSRLEDFEKLEQLRILESGERIKVIETAQDSLGIDTEEDLKNAQEIFKQLNA